MHSKAFRHFITPKVGGGRGLNKRLLLFIGSTLEDGGWRDTL